jgi:predicted outer membrane protein
MKHSVIASMALTGLLVCSAGAQTNRVSKMGHSPGNTFVTKAAQGCMAGVDLGTLATQHASNETLAASKGMTLPVSLESKSQSAKNHLSGLSGAAFDRACMQDMVNDYQQDI